MRTLLAAFSAVLLGACSLVGSAQSSETGIASFAPAERQQAPPVQAATVDGEEMALQDYEGQVVLVNFWASWCGPCLTEAPHLNAVARQYEADGVVVVGVNAGDQRERARAFVRDNDLVFQSWFDADQRIAASFGSAGPAGMPTTLLLDAEHRVAYRFLGAVTGASLAPRIGALLEEAA